MYKFRRIGKDGEILEDEEEEEDAESSVEIDDSENSEKQRLEIESKNKPEEKPKNAISAMSERQKLLQKHAKKAYKKDMRDQENGVRYEFVVEPSLIPNRFSTFIGRMEAVKLYNEKIKSFVATVIYRVNPQRDEESRQAPTRTLLYSHGNATDIGAMSIMQCYLARGLNVNVVMYDYSGYGASGGTPLEKNTYSDIETVFNYVVKHVADDKPEDVIIYGQSVGSGPSCHLCSKKLVGGLILHSPFMSGIRVLTPSRALACLDIFPNIDRIKKVNCPVMIIHGVLDEEVDMAHGVALHNAVKPEYKRDPWWVKDRGHNDICEGSGKMNEYILRLKVFLNSLDDCSEVGSALSSPQRMDRNTMVN